MLTPSVRKLLTKFQFAPNICLVSLTGFDSCLYSRCSHNFSFPLESLVVRIFSIHCPSWLELLIFIMRFHKTLFFSLLFYSSLFVYLWSTNKYVLPTFLSVLWEAVLCSGNSLGLHLLRTRFEFMQGYRPSWLELIMALLTHCRNIWLMVYYTKRQQHVTVYHWNM